MASVTDQRVLNLVSSLVYTLDSIDQTLEEIEHALGSQVKQAEELIWAVKDIVKELSLTRTD